MGGSDDDVAVSSGSDILGLDTGWESNALPVDTMPSVKFTSGGDDPWSAVGLNGDSGGGLGANLTPGLSVPSEGDTVSSNDPDSIVGSDSDVGSGSGSSLPLDSLEGETSLAGMFGGSDGS